MDKKIGWDSYSLFMIYLDIQNLCRSKYHSRSLQMKQVLPVAKLKMLSYKQGDNDYHQRRGTGLSIYLNEPLHCPKAFSYFEMLREFRKHGHWTIHDAHAHRRVHALYPEGVKSKFLYPFMILNMHLKG